ncbi:hypothetical protein K504DRAFT_446796 [Pleomassaria siparia CBS 279.74]|uniref:FHA domain-containing protein n=1 Tax=Pleomassaria siparia CBS 279.74 TaxID=1314801 RepID=A0A6G1K5G1_9PLEO|nr:hypothetical protein K504DRAFT_446796 [Pleomassaria siparia CBS 279.74]
MSSDSAVEVTLRSIDGLDDFPERKFILSPNMSMPVGRSSKNANKKLMSGVDNAFIDSPVISREHASIFTKDTQGIFITDDGSMHGTFVNEQALVRHSQYKLNNGDTLQFGLNVVRDTGMFTHPDALRPQTDPAFLDAFVAKKYSFTFEPAQPAQPTSHGFSVPDVESEEEEEIEDEEALRASRYGSQRNPVNIDDFEDIPRAVIDLEEEEPAITKQPSSPKANEPNLRRHDLPPYQPRVFPTEVTPSMEDSEPLSRVTMDHVDNAEDDDDSMEAYNGSQNYGDIIPESPAEEDDDYDNSSRFNEGSLHSEEEANTSNLSQAGSMDQSDSELDSESEADEQADHVRKIKLAAMVNHEQQKDADEEHCSATAHIHTSPHTIQSHCSAAINFSANDTVPQSEVRKHAAINPNNLFGAAFAHEAWSSGAMHSALPTSLPPRPSAPKPTIWGPPPPLETFQHHYPSYIGHENWVEQHPTAENPLITHMAASASRPPRKDYLDQVLNNEPAPAKGIHTPPMPALDEVNPVMPQVSRRTKVSIPEIVEDIPQQPPTPTSVGSPKNGKRKAEVMDDDETDTVEVSTVAVAVVEEVLTDHSVQATAQEPPAKRRRTLGARASNVGSFIAGVTFAVGALLYLPEIAFA